MCARRRRRGRRSFEGGKAATRRSETAGFAFSMKGEELMTDQVTAIHRDQRDDTVCARRLCFQISWRAGVTRCQAARRASCFLLIRICGEQIGVKQSRGLSCKPINRDFMVRVGVIAPSASRWLLSSPAICRRRRARRQICHAAPPHTADVFVS